jgi:hypothetical protein
MKNINLNLVEIGVLVLLSLLLSKGFLGIVALSFIILIVKLIIRKITNKNILPTRTLRNGFYAGFIVELIKVVL